MASVNTNVLSMQAQKNLKISEDMMATSLARLSSGLRINSASDDAAGLAISSRMTSQIGGLAQANRNANDALSVMQTAEAGQTEINNILQRLRELVVQGANDSNSSTDRGAIQTEIGQLVEQIDTIAGTTSFNGQNLIGTGSDKELSFHVGANDTAFDEISVTLKDLQASSIIKNDDGVAQSISVEASGSMTGADNAELAIGYIDNAINTVNTERATVGAVQNRLESSMDANQSMKERLEEARGRIRDVDFASESAQLTKAQVLQQAGTAILTQANAVPQNALAFLR